VSYDRCEVVSQRPELTSSNSREAFIVAGLGKILILLGGVLIVVGFILVLVPRIPYIGKLPGDIHVKSENFEIYLPLASSILLSIIVSGILWTIGLIGKK
jgi:hypothetical protein